MKSKLIITLILLTFLPNAVFSQSSYTPYAENSCISECSNQTLIVDGRDLIVPCENVSGIYDSRPQLANDSIFSDIMTNYSEFFYSFYVTNTQIILPGMNGSTFFEVAVQLDSASGPVVGYHVVTEESLEYNMTMILNRAIEELQLRHHTLEGNIVRPVLWAGEWGLPTYGGPNNFYLENATFDSLHWEILFKTNNTQYSNQGGLEVHEIPVITNAIMIFLSNGTLLDFYMEPIPLSDGSPVLFYAIAAISATVVIGIVLLFVRRRR